jgi:Kyakuja-Dileera-Zisupton transposase
MDGNDSLKHIHRHMQDDEGIPGLSCEHINTRTIGRDFYLAWAEVDKWAEQGIQEIKIMLQEDADYNPCADQWKNMKDDITKQMWAIFDETGIFLALCRHGFSLVIADMVQSGKL